MATTEVNYFSGGGVQVYCETGVSNSRDYNNLFVDCGFVPKKISIMTKVSNTSTAVRWACYDADEDSENVVVGIQGADVTKYAIGNANSMIASIEPTGGFTLYNLGNGYPYGSISIIATS